MWRVFAKHYPYISTFIYKLAEKWEKIGDVLTIATSTCNEGQLRDFWQD
jgi:hypothetical protein